MTSPSNAAVKSPAVSVLIINYDSGAHLSNAVRALMRQSLADIEVIVLDNGSRDHSFEEARRLASEDKRFVFVEAGHNLGFAAGNNLAAGNARAPWLALLNPDAVPAPDWLAQLMAGTRRHRDAVMFGSTQLNARDPRALDGAGDHYLATGLPWRGGHGWPSQRAPAEREVFAPCGAACLIRTDVFRAASGFDERFFCYVEDIDLAFRLRLLGHRCIQLPQAVVQHVGTAAADREDSVLPDQCGMRNLIWCFVKCMPGPLFWPLLPFHILTVLVWAAGHGKPGWEGLWLGLRGLPTTWASRLMVQRSRRIAWWRIALMLSWNPFAYLRRAP